MNYHFLQKIIRFLTQGKVGVIPTDTIYGIVGSALSPETVEEIYELRKRDKDKPMIILISDFTDLEKFEVKIPEQIRKLWPNPISIILPCTSERFTYLHRGKKTLAFRMPKNEWLLDLLKSVGPLVAPSANIAGQKEAETIAEAKKYFGDKVFYIDKGQLIAKPSTLIEIRQGEINILRQGIIPLCELLAKF